MKTGLIVLGLLAWQPSGAWSTLARNRQVAALRAAPALPGDYLGAAPQTLVQQIADSGRCVDLGERPDQQVAEPPMIAPGPPPLISFRYYEGKQHYRFGNAELMLDDAGH